MSGEQQQPAQPDFSQLDTLITNAVGANKLPGAVVVIGHSGHIAYEHAYGLRKLANEPGLDGKPSPAEPMTEDTIFDMASLTKCLATATSVMQLYEAGKIGSFDDPVQKYLPDFNASNDPQRAKVTLRMLLTHTSGEAPDVNLKDPWGLAAPDKAEGIHRAITTPLAGTPGTKFVYSDINFILLGTLVEKLSREREDDYVHEHVFIPLEMSETSYHSADRAVGFKRPANAATPPTPKPTTPDEIFKTLQALRVANQESTWNPANLRRTAPTAHDDESKSNPALNPDFDHLLRGTVHDPTTRRMGGVAGHAGVFSTAHDMSLFAQALLDRLAGRPSNFPLKQSTLELMTTPEQPGHTTTQLSAANSANLAAMSGGNGPSGRMSGAPSVTASSSRVGSTNASPATDPLLAPNYPAIKGQDLRAFGWDIDTAFSKPRGRIFPIGSFGHTGFTGTSLWLDPGSDTYVILLANAIHPRGGAPISALRGEVATAAAQALHLYTSTAKNVGAPHVTASSSRVGSAGRQSTNPDFPQKPVISTEARSAEWRDPRISPGAPQKAALLRTAYSPNSASRYPKPSGLALSDQPEEDGFQPLGYALPQPAVDVVTGIDVLESSNAAALKQLANNKPLKIGLLTNQSGLDKQGHRTIDYLASLRSDNVQLTTLFSPEHGISGAHDTEKFAAETDEKTGLHVTSLYGVHESDRRPSHDQLKDLDAVVIDLQDAGVRTYTYPAIVGYFLEASAAEKATYQHDLAIVILDRPNLIDGSDVQGPFSDPDGGVKYNNYTPLPVRHGFTLGEFARYVRLEKHVAANLVIVPMQGWQRTEYMDQTGLIKDKWINPSPNLRNQDAAILLAGLTLIETTNVSVGRGTDTPFELFGAGFSTASGAPSVTASPSRVGSANVGPAKWFKAQEVAAALTTRKIPGVTFEPAATQVDNDPIHPFHGQTIEAVRIHITDRNALDTPELGVEILSALHKLYPTDFKLARAANLLANKEVLEAITRGDDPRAIAASWQPALDHFKEARKPYLLY